MPTSSAARDHASDLVRAVCIAGVVTLHALMVGVTVSSDGPVFANAGETGTWLIPVSWLLQVMPLFFVIGGFTGRRSLQQVRRRGGSGTGFAASRVHRLVVPSIIAVGGVGVLLLAAAVAGMDPALIDIAGYRFGQPLWFLGVFLLCQGLLPVFMRWHERHPLLTVTALALAALAVDVVRDASGITGIGFANLLFVWLAMQRLGFFLADGRIDALPRRTRILAALLAAGLLVGSFAGGFHSPDLVANINPPTTALILVGIIHTAAFSLLREKLGLLAARRGIRAVITFISNRSMTIYLWHMPVLLALAGMTAAVAQLTQLAPPAPDTPMWWATRPLWLLATVAGTAAVSVALARLERVRPNIDSPSPARVSASVATAAGAVCAVLIMGFSPATATLAVGAWCVALRMLRAPQRANHSRIRSARDAPRDERVSHLVGMTQRHHQQGQRGPQS